MLKLKLYNGYPLAPDKIEIKCLLTNERLVIFIIWYPSGTVKKMVSNFLI